MSKQVQCCKCDETCPIHHTSDNIPEDAKPYLEFRSRLDSMAPELLEALKGAREALGPSPWGSLRHEIDALIAKAEGE